jgi:hypothetical protein
VDNAQVPIAKSFCCFPGNTDSRLDVIFIEERKEENLFALFFLAGSLKDNNDLLKMYNDTWRNRMSDCCPIGTNSATIKHDCISHLALFLQRKILNRRGQYFLNDQTILLLPRRGNWFVAQPC